MMKRRTKIRLAVILGIVFLVACGVAVFLSYMSEDPRGPEIIVLPSHGGPVRSSFAWRGMVLELQKMKAARSFKKGVLVFTSSESGSMELRRHPPWACSQLDSIRVYEAGRLSNRTIDLIRKNVNYGNDILKVAKTLDDNKIPFEPYKVGARFRHYTYCFISALSANRYIVCLFADVSGYYTYWLTDVFIVTIQNHIADILFDVIPHRVKDSHDSIQNIVWHYDQAFEYIEIKALTISINKAREALIAPPPELPKMTLDLEDE